jgi:hypothetical protein
MAIRTRFGFLESNDEPFIPLETVESWLSAAPAPPSRGQGAKTSIPHPVSEVESVPPSPDAGQYRGMALGMQQPDDNRELHEKLALLEDQIHRLSLERPPPPPPPPSLSPDRSRARSPPDRDRIAQLEQAHCTNRSSNPALLSSERRLARTGQGA